MFATHIHFRVLLLTLLAGVGPVQAGEIQGNDGSVILRMCKGADQVRALSVMCHSYLNGYLDGARHYGKGKLAFCLAAGDKEKVPAALVDWIVAHPDAQKQAAGAVLHQMLMERFPCKGGK
ncbi:MAG: hypothetical protein B7Y41_12985 [Hydrogenophilales bacterium 28-61-23]|nr:MAG: hypothetical protein B7Y41_12985 [Hydrogenophilales bacterium 28-61-23]